MVPAESIVMTAPKGAYPVLTEELYMGLSEMGETQHVQAYFTLTPEMCSWILENKNDRNRRIGKARVKKLVEIIKKGEFNRPLTHQALGVLTSSQLGDGQHRCAAVVEADQNVVCLMVFGIEPDAQSHMDMVYNRRASHFLSMKGYKNVGHLQTATKESFNLNRVQIGLAYDKTMTFTPQDTLTFMQDYPEIETHSLRHVLGIKKKRGNLGLPVSLPRSVAIHFVLSRVDPDAADDFIRGWLTADPRHDIFPMLASATTELKEGDRRSIMYKTVFKAWEMYRSGNFSPSRLGLQETWMMLAGYNPLPE